MAPPIASKRAATKQPPQNTQAKKKVRINEADRSMLQQDQQVELTEEQFEEEIQKTLEKRKIDIHLWR